MTIFEWQLTTSLWKIAIVNFCMVYCDWKFLVVLLQLTTFYLCIVTAQQQPQPQQQNNHNCSLVETSTNLGFITPFIVGLSFGPSCAVVGSVLSWSVRLTSSLDEHSIRHFPGHPHSSVEGVKAFDDLDNRGGCTKFWKHDDIILERSHASINVWTVFYHHSVIAHYVV